MVRTFLALIDINIDFDITDTNLYITVCTNTSIESKGDMSTFHVKY